MNNKDWTGNHKSTFTSLGASSHALTEREEHDYYATEPRAIELLLEQESFSNVWECACGTGHLAKVLESRGLLGKATDLIDRGYATGGVDFIRSWDKWDGDIITNPPYKYTETFVERALDIIPTGRKVAMFIGIQFLEGKKRKTFLERNNIKTVYVSSSRLNCAKNGDFTTYSGNSARCYAWYVWEKGFIGDTTLKWIN